MKRRPPNVSVFTDRHGVERYRWRYKGKSRYLPGHWSLPESKALLERLNAEKDSLKPIACAAPGSIDDIVARFYRSGSFNKAGAERQARIRGILERFRDEYGADHISDFDAEIIEAILIKTAAKRREGKRDVGGAVAALNLHKLLKRLWKIAMRAGFATKNEAELAEGVKQTKGGFHSWTEEEIAQYRQRHPLGTMARLYAEIILWTWQRRGDAHRFGRQHMKGERIQYTQAKGDKTLWLPAAPQLLAAIRAMTLTGTETFIVNEYGKPFTKNGIGNKMREWCDEAGLPQCSAHGLRKAAARRAAERGATNQMLKAAGGWSNSAEVDTYTAAAAQEELATEIVMRVSRWEEEQG